MAEYVAGLEHLYERLQHLKTVDQRKLVRRALRQAAKDVMAEEMRTSPIKTGGIFWSYQVRAIRRSRRGIGYRVTNQVPKRMRGVMKYYASFVNYGTKYITAQRFMNRAVASVAKDTLKDITTAIVGELNALGH